jgi:DNA-binding transcriptional LysR family regulator
MITTQEIACFVTVAQTSSFTLAGQQLGMSQQAISRCIAGLETRYAMQLFERHTRRVQLTADAQSFLPLAQHAQHALKEIDDWLRAKHGLEQRPLRVGYTVSAQDLIMKHFLPAWQQQGVLAMITEMNSAQQERELLAQRLDIGFLHPPLGAAARSELKLQALSDEPMLAVLPPDHRLKNEKVLSLAQLCKEPWILFDRDQGPVLYDSILKGLSASGHAPDVRAHLMPHHVRADAAVLQNCVTVIVKSAVGSMREVASFAPCSDVRLPLAMAWLSNIQHPALHLTLTLSKQKG